MIRSQIPNWTRSIVFWGHVGSSLLIGGAGFALNCTGVVLDGRGVVFRRLLVVVQHWAPEIAITGAIGVLVCTLVGKVASDARIWRVIHAHLDDFRRHSCDEEIADHKHKVTLFEHRRWVWTWRGFNRKSWFWSGWLVPVERSGTRNLKTKMFFHAPVHRADRAEGIAGQAWASNAQHLRVGPLQLPSGHDDSDGIKKYAKATNISSKIVQKYLTDSRHLPVAFFAHVIEVDSKPWGVLVVDSQSDAICSHEKLLKAFKVVAPALGRLLLEAKGAHD